MKKILLTLACVLMQASASAQLGLRILNHLSVGAEIGTPGWGVDVAVPFTPFFDVQAGFTMLPKFSLSPSLKMSDVTYADGQTLSMSSVGMSGHPTMKEGKLLVNFMPLTLLSGFHITAGIYIGSGNIIEMRNDDPLTELAAANQAIDAYNERHPDAAQEHIGLKLGHYLLEPDQDGNIVARACVNKVKPYVGIGFGRAVPKGRIGLKVDLGCIIWGKPSVYCNDLKVSTTDIGDLSGGLTKVISKMPVYPVLNVRLCGRIF